jgi:hypothetical protein
MTVYALRGTGYGKGKRRVPGSGFRFPGKDALRDSLALSSRPKSRDLARSGSARLPCRTSACEVPDIGYRRFRDDMVCVVTVMRFLVSLGSVVPAEEPGPRTFGVRTAAVPDVCVRGPGYRLPPIPGRHGLCGCGNATLMSLGSVVPAEEPGPRKYGVRTAAVPSVCVRGPGYRLPPIPGRHGLCGYGNAIFGVPWLCRPGRRAGTSHVRDQHGCRAGRQRARSRISATADSGTTWFVWLR